MKYILPIFLLPAFFLLSCQHETDMFDGPSLIDRFGEFQLQDSLSASTSEVDFSAGEQVFFTASFSKQVAWTLRVTGLESGSVKLIEGFDRELNETNASWDGTTTELPLFTTENCLAELIIPEEDSLTISTEVSVSGARVYEGNVITGFEEDLGSSLFLGNFEFELSNSTGITSSLPAGEGDRFYFFEGTDNTVSNFFVGLIRIFPSVNNQTYFEIPSQDPSSVYLNFFLFGDLTPHTIAVVQVFTDANDSGQFEEADDQSFQLDGDFPIDFEGWKQFSFTLDEIGMSEQQISEIVGIQVLLISNMNSQPTPPNPVRFGIDYLTFTKDQPLQP